MNATHENQNIAVLSADICGSTAIYEAMGDTAARLILGNAITLLKRICVQHNGRVVAEIGDQIVALFNDAEQAATASCEMHAALSEDENPKDASKIHVRIGLHIGPVASNMDALIGETTKIANWASTNAKADQTLATLALIDRLSGIFRAVSRYVDDETWNFITIEHIALYEIVWDVESVTAYGGELIERDALGYDAVEFEYAGKALVVNINRPVISIGRDALCDLVIPKDLVSRQHLSAQFSRHRCTISDKSTNGSLIVTADGDRVELKRESHRLLGHGTIIPGNPPAPGLSGYQINYRCF
jgi:adenylate cyclase